MHTLPFPFVNQSHNARYARGSSRRVTVGRGNPGVDKVTFFAHNMCELLPDHFVA
jgi:hypothetical protein